VITVEEYPATFCACPREVIQRNGYGSCLRCGGAYEAEGPIAPIYVPETVDQAEVISIEDKRRGKSQRASKGDL
jgi:hypothetical protein